MPAIDLEVRHQEIGELLLQIMRDAKIPPMDAQLCLVAALGLLADAAISRRACVENSIAMLAQLPGVGDSDSRIAAAVMAACDDIHRETSS